MGAIPQPKILVFDAHNAESLAFILGERFGYSVDHVSSMDDLMAAIKQTRFNLLILDLCDSYCRELAEEFQKLPAEVLFLTCGEDMHSFLLPTGNENVLQKPLDPWQFVLTVRALLGESVQ